jgi:hypothetical protein
VIASGVSAPSYSDSGLDASTIYDYCVLAASGAGYSAASATSSAETGVQPDVLSAQALIITPTKGIPFIGSVAIFTDANTSATAGRFVAIIHWGDGAVSRGTINGGDGNFAILGRHTYSRAGHFAVKVNVTMSAPVKGGTSITSRANVSTQLRSLNRKSSKVRRGSARRGRLP